MVVTDSDWVDDYRAWWNEGFHEESRLYSSPTYLLKVTDGGVLLSWHQEDDRYEVFPAHAWRRVSAPHANSPDSTCRRTGAVAVDADGPLCVSAAEDRSRCRQPGHGSRRS